MAQAARSAPTSVPEISGGAHFPCLDAYRGIGMMMVLLSHASFATGNTPRSDLGPYLSRFELAVPMFFMLSGFLLYRPYALASLRERDPLGPGRFLRRRALRIFPGYWAALIGIVLLFGAGSLDSVWDWVCNLLLLQQFGVNEPYRITQAWSIGVELSFYLLLPLYAAGIARWAGTRPGRLVAGCAGLFAIGWAFRIGVVATAPLPTDPDFATAWQPRSLEWLPMYLDFFAIGMGLSVISATAQLGNPLPRLARALGDHAAACWLFALGVFVLVAQMDPPPTPFGLNGNEYLPRQLAYCFGSTVWLAPAIFGNQQQGRLRSFLSSRPLTWLGAISLSFYLWHLDLIHQAQAWTVPHWDAREALAANPSNALEALATFAGNFWEVAAIAIVTTLIVAAIMHRFVELPFLLLKDRPLRDLPQTYRAALRPAGAAPVPPGTAGHA
jgi:peptidoglycan/LPS O-acetylase OafA/YrhL